jgi:hypothetical protein
MHIIAKKKQEMIIIGSCCSLLGQHLSAVEVHFKAIHFESEEKAAHIPTPEDYYSFE